MSNSALEVGHLGSVTDRIVLYPLRLGLIISRYIRDRCTSCMVYQTFARFRSMIGTFPYVVHTDGKTCLP